MTDKWLPEDFSRMRYELQQGESKEFDRAKRIETIVKVDTIVVARLQLREPGILAVVSRPDSQGIDIEVVTPGGQRYTDLMVPGSGNMSSTIADWQEIALLRERR